MTRNSVKLLKQCENIFLSVHIKNLAMTKSACQKQDKLGNHKSRVIAINKQCDIDKNQCEDGKSSVTMIKTVQKYI